MTALTLALLMVSGAGMGWLVFVSAQGLFYHGRWLLQQRRRRKQNTPLTLRVIQRHDFNPQRFMVRLAGPDNAPLPKFNPGQFLTICVALDDSDLPGKRRYSISNWQRVPRYYELCIRRVANGRVSSRLFDILQTGVEIPVLPPAGSAFPLPQKNREVILIAGGVGISPVRSIIHYLLQRGDSSRISLFYSAAKRSDLCYFAEFSAASRLQDNFRFYPTLTREAPDWQHGTGRITVGRVMESVANAQQALFILGGPETMQNSLLTGLQTQGIHSAQIYFERFGAGNPPTPARTYMIQLQSGRQFPFATQPTLLAALEEQSLAIAGSCRSGECGECRIRLLQGQITMLNKASYTLPNQEILPCCCIPASDLVIAI